MKLDQITIEHGIPIPDRYQWHRKWKPVFKAMRPGDSILVECKRIRHAVISAARNAGITITSRKIDGGGYRVWMLTKRAKIKPTREQKA